jgi:hypothetical protein
LCVCPTCGIKEPSASAKRTGNRLVGRPSPYIAKKPKEPDVYHESWKQGHHSALKYYTIYTRGSLGFLGHCFLFLFTYYNTAFLLSRALQPSKLTIFFSSKPQAFRLYTLYPSLGIISRGSLLHVSGAHSNWLREGHSHRPHGTFAHTRIAFCGLDILYCNSIAQHVPIPFGRSGYTQFHWWSAGRK